MAIKESMTMRPFRQTGFSVLTILLLLTVFGTSGCSLFENNSNDFEVIAAIEGKIWSGSSSSYLENGTLTIIGREKGSECNFEGIYINIPKFDGEGSYPVFNTSYSSLVGCDAIAAYGRSSDTTGTATVTKFNEMNGIVEGKFSIEMVGRYNHDNIKEGEPFTITGRFKAKIEERN